MVYKRRDGSIEIELMGLLIVVKNANPFTKIIELRYGKKVRGLWWPPRAKKYARAVRSFVDRYLAAPDTIVVGAERRLAGVQKRLVALLAGRAPRVVGE